jgi:hypothetical protein
MLPISFPTAARRFLCRSASGRECCSVRIAKDGTVVVSSPKVAVRYAWADNLDAYLVNSAGLHASPIRTDTWDVTEE